MENSRYRESKEKINLMFRLLLWFVLAGLAAGLGYAVIMLPTEASGLAGPVADNLSASGVSNPVTAVLLNYRSYDTLLEMGVLLLALIGVWSLDPKGWPLQRTPGPVLLFLMQVLVPLMIIVAGYLLWVGAYEPGGAFQAGSVLAAAGVLMILCGRHLPKRLAGWPLRLALVSGTAIFIAVGMALMVPGGHLLEFPAPYVKELILLIEAVATFSIGVTLAILFLGRRPETEDRE